MKKTKIICTMGPNTNDRELIKQLALNGMDIARFNFSHGDHEEQAGRFALVKSVREEINKPIACLLYTSKDYYANQEYDKAYNSLDGIKLSGDDETLYKQAKVVMYVQRQYESYENYEKMNMHTEALNALVKGVDRYQTYRSEAKELGVEDKMTERCV